MYSSSFQRTRRSFTAPGPAFVSATRPTHGVAMSAPNTISLPSASGTRRAEKPFANV
ncbi:MAG: hypothetical protein U1E39_15825 [Planctomycetota bacterium]